MLPSTMLPSIGFIIFIILPLGFVIHQNIKELGRVLGLMQSAASMIVVLAVLHLFGLGLLGCASALVADLIVRVAVALARHEIISAPRS